MTDQTNPNTETVATAVQAATDTETITALPPEVPIEEWDKERAAKTIQAQRDENRALKARAKRADELEAEAKKRADAELSETDRLKKENEEIKAENARTKNALMRTEAVQAAGLPADFAKRLTGETAEELLADAQELAKTLPQIKTAPKLPSANPGNVSTQQTEDQFRQQLFGGGSTKMSRAEVERLGGGVIWKDK